MRILELTGAGCLCAIWILVSSFCCPLAAFAQSPVKPAKSATTSSTALTPAAPAAPAPVAPPGFAPVSGLEERAERVDATVLVTLAYVSIFGLLIGYLVFLNRGRREMRREIRELEAKLRKQENQD